MIFGAHNNANISEYKYSDIDILAYIGVETFFGVILLMWLSNTCDKEINGGKIF